MALYGSIYIIIHSWWNVALIFMKERVKPLDMNLRGAAALEDILMYLVLITPLHAGNIFMKFFVVC